MTRYIDGPWLQIVRRIAGGQNSRDKLSAQMLPTRARKTHRMVDIMIGLGLLAETEGILHLTETGKSQIPPAGQSPTQTPIRVRHEEERP